MSTSYPTSKQSFTNPAPGDVVASALIGNMADTIEAIEDEIGNTSPAGGTLRKRVADLEAAGSASDASAGNPEPALHGLKVWNFDPCLSSGNQRAATAGTLVVFSVWVPKAMTITNLHTIFTAVGSGNTYMALYSGAGALLSQSPATNSASGSAGIRTFVLNTPQAVTAGRHYIALWATSTSPSFMRTTGGFGTYDVNVNLAAGTFRCATANTGLTTTAPSTIGTMTAMTELWWVGAS